LQACGSSLQRRSLTATSSREIPLELGKQTAKFLRVQCIYRIHLGRQGRKLSICNSPGFCSFALRALGQFFVPRGTLRLRVPF